MFFKREISWLVSVILILVTALSLSLKNIDNIKNEKKQVMHTLIETKRKYNIAKENKNILSSTEGVYQHIKNKGLVGNEDRLSWIKAIDNIADKYQLKDLKYKIEKQSIIDNENISTAYRGINISQSILKIDMKLLHMGDYIKFNNDLNNLSKGGLDIKQCEWRRLFIKFDDILKYKKSKNINVQCTYIGLSVKAKAI